MASSSKKKSSKKKSSKLSSKTKRIKKSHRNASKKVGCRHDSSSEDSVRLHSVSLPSSDSNSDNDSASSLSMSSSSSEGTYRSRKKGSRLKKDKSRVSRKPSDKEDLARGKKRKRSKKKKSHHESRKKSQKKKPRRHASISSVDGDSSSSTSEESDIQTHRSKLKKNKKRRVESEVGAVLNKERTIKSPKGSSNSRSSDQRNSVSQDQENFVSENKPMRLKSVITVVVKPHEEEEYTLEKDDNSSMKSKREELMNEFEKDSNGHIQTDDSPSGNSLEAVLRRKALENLKKFRGKVETDVKTIGNESKKDDDIGKNVVVMKKPVDPGTSNVNEIKKDDVIANQVSIAKEKFVWRRLPQQVSNNITGSEAAKVNAVDPFDTSLLPQDPIKQHGSSQAFDTKSESGSLLHQVKHLKTRSVSSGKEVIVDKVTEANHSTSSINSDDDHKRKIKDVSAPISVTEHPSNDQKNEAKQGSDFKEKKMSVMRGGEMVEVSYKVYIPQRAPALARRQLKR